MIDFVESYMTDINSQSSAFDKCDTDSQKILLKSISKVLPLIIEKELTPRQSLCVRLFYIHGKNQPEIAKQLKLSQPTVSRHIHTAKSVINKYLGYCFYSVKLANEQWLSME